MKINISIFSQTLTLSEENKIIAHYPISTGKNGTGEHYGSEKTPRGLHEIHSKIGENAPINTVFVAREPTGEIFNEILRTQQPTRDWILTRILRLHGLEPGKNQGGDVDTLKRCIYIHGCPDNTPLQIPGSHGCIRLHNNDIIELFNFVTVGTHVFISEQ